MYIVHVTCMYYRIHKYFFLCSAAAVQLLSIDAIALRYYIVIDAERDASFLWCVTQQKKKTIFKLAIRPNFCNKMLWLKSIISSGI